MGALKTLDTNQGYSRGIIDTPVRISETSILWTASVQQSHQQAPTHAEESESSFSKFAKEFSYTTNLSKAVEQATSTAFDAVISRMESGKIRDGITNVKKDRAAKRIR